MLPLMACSKDPERLRRALFLMDSGVPQPTSPATSSTMVPSRSPPVLVGLGASVVVHEERRFSWRQVEGLNWQAVAETLQPLARDRPKDAAGCPEGMVLVQGNMLMDSRSSDESDEVQLAQNEACTRWMTGDRGVNGLCTRFDADRWEARAAAFPRRAMRFCIDRWEFPNSFGEYPLVVTRYVESEAWCRKVGKRLCTETEWTFACEGEQARPFPYGYESDKDACLIDVLAAGAPEGTYEPRTLPSTARGIDVAWQGRRSGESPRCSSPFGVEDMTGNVDEWTTSVRKYGYRMILKGGHWGPGRHRCRPQTRGHGPMYVRHDQGFRCCRDTE